MSAMRIYMQLCCYPICNAEQNKSAIRSLADIRNYPQSTGIDLPKISAFRMARSFMKWGLEN
jgi:hypothetical protein